MKNCDAVYVLCNSGNLWHKVGKIMDGICVSNYKANS